MEYSFFILSKEKEISQNDFAKAISSLSDCNKQCLEKPPFFTVSLEHPNYIKVSSNHEKVINYAEGFVLNLLVCLQSLGYTPKMFSEKWVYGTLEDFEQIKILSKNNIYEKVT